MSHTNRTCIRTLSYLFVCFLLLSTGRANAQEIDGSREQYQRLALTFEGPHAEETGSPNPFTDYRFTVTFTHTSSGRSYEVPGFFAADGDAANSGSNAGNKWRAYFRPDRAGEWQYEASFRQGSNAAVSLDRQAGQSAAFDGTSGAVTIDAASSNASGFYGKGFLRYVGERYLRFDNGEYFVKGGANSPENFLGYEDFDGTPASHSYDPHTGDWQNGDPTWKDGRGKGIIGALNYLSGKGMNVVYFLTMNVNGDGQDVWPWTNQNQHRRFDVSKLEQWELTFEHMDRKGLMLHVVTQEQENDQLLNGGDLGLERKLYYRELIARFGHHLALQWNLGEENTNSGAQRKAFAEYIRQVDPYDHPIVVHTYPGDKDEVYGSLTGYSDVEGASLQGSMYYAHQTAKKWIGEAENSGRSWVVAQDEIGPFDEGVSPDGGGSNHDAVRKNALWGNLMAGGAGVEWYFGYKFQHDDINTEDWRTRDQMWEYTRHALEFFQNHLPFEQMEENDGWVSGQDNWVLAKEGEIYAVYLPDGGSANLELPAGSYTVEWYNPRQGGSLKQGTSGEILGGGSVSIGQPPGSTNQDWAALVRSSDGITDGGDEDDSATDDGSDQNDDDTGDGSDQDEDDTNGGTDQTEDGADQGSDDETTSDEQLVQFPEDQFPLYFGDSVGRTRSAQVHLNDPSNADQIELHITAYDINELEEATLFVNGTEVPLPESIVSDGESVTASTELNSDHLVDGTNSVTFEISKLVNGSEEKFRYRIEDLAFSFAAAGDDSSDSAGDADKNGGDSTDDSSGEDSGDNTGDDSSDEDSADTGDQEENTDESDQSTGDTSDDTSDETSDDSSDETGDDQTSDDSADDSTDDSSGDDRASDGSEDDSSDNSSGDQGEDNDDQQTGSDEDDGDETDDEDRVGTNTDRKDLPREFALQGNYPNPFNPTTNIVFNLPTTARVSVQVFDMLGRQIMEVPARQIAAGAERSVQLDASRLTSGTYIYRLVAQTRAETLVRTGRMTLLK